MKRIFILFFILSSLQVFAGGGWPQKKGEGYFKFGQGMIRASHYYTPDGSVEDITTTSYYATYVYGEYGLTNRFTTIGYFPLLARVTQNQVVDAETGDEIIPGDQLTSVGDATIGLKYGIFPKGKVVWSVELDLKIPFGNDAGGNTGLLQTGDGAFSQLVKTEVSTARGDFYYSGMLGVRHRGKDYSDDWHAGLEVGWNKNERFYAIIKMNSIQSFYNSDVLNAGNSLFGNNLEYVAIGPEFHYFFKNNWGVNATVVGAVQGRNMLADPYFGVGISYNLLKPGGKS
jgi:hypothetical protein